MDLDIGPGVAHLAKMGGHCQKQLKIFQTFLGAVEALSPSIPTLASHQLAQSPHEFSYLGVRYRMRALFQGVGADPGVRWVTSLHIVAAPGAEDAHSKVRIGSRDIFFDDDGHVYTLVKKADVIHLRDTGLVLPGHADRVFAYMAIGGWGPSPTT